LGLRWSSLSKIRVKTPLSQAAENGDKVVVELLLKNGAQPDFEDGNRCTPLSRAIEKGHAAVVELLLAQGVIKVDYQYGHVSRFNKPRLD
jgi:ankyrin repeat protein